MSNVILDRPIKRASSLVTTKKLHMPCGPSIYFFGAYGPLMSYLHITAPNGRMKCPFCPRMNLG